MKYNYVFFNAPDSIWGKKADGFYTIRLEDLYENKKVQVIATPLEHKSKAIQFVRKLHVSRTINKIVKLKGESLWYPLWVDLKFPKTNHLCFVFYCHEDLGYIRYLKKKYNNCRIVKVHGDKVSVFLKGGHEDFEEFYQKKLYPFDLIYTYDKKEADTYNARHILNFESKVDIDIDNNYPLWDVFFAGRAKDRFPKLIAVYEKLVNAGLKVNYYLAGVSKNERKSLPGITYGDKMMSYREILYNTVNARCVLDINQSGTIGYTARFMEAVMYNKRLISDNSSIKDSKFYNSKFMQYIDDVNDIDINKIIDDTSVEYGYKDEFSPIHLIEQIDNDLCALDNNTYLCDIAD